MNKKTRQEVRKNRLWKHWLFWMGEPFGPDLKRMDGWEAERYRAAFERFQSLGAKALSPDELRGIHPLIAAQKAKEVLLTSLAEESLEYWAKGWGWRVPWQHVCDTRNIGRKPLDRLTYVAMLRTMKSIAADPVAFFDRHPGISTRTKERYFGLKFA